MEVEIEDLHVQMEDISKTKQAVSAALSLLTASAGNYGHVFLSDAQRLCLSGSQALSLSHLYRGHWQ